MNLKIDNIIITEKITNLNFDELKLNQQVIVLEEKETHKNILSYYLFNKPFDNVFCFNETNCNLLISTDHCINELASDANTDYCCFLQIGNNMVEITFDEYDVENMYDFDEDYNNYKLIKDRYKLMSQFGLNASDSITYCKKNNTTNINYTSLIDLKHCYLAIEISNNLNPTRYYWNKDINILILNKELNKYIDISIVGGIRYLIKALTDIYENQYYFIERCLDFLNVYSYPITTIIPDNKKIDLVNKCFKDIDTLNKEDIMKYFKPVLIDEKNNFKAYFGNFYTFSSPNPYIQYSIHELDSSELKKFKRKAKAIIESLTQESIIDIYSGECIKNDWTERYKDYKYLLITRKNNSTNIDFSKQISENETIDYYELVDNVYVSVEYFNQRNIRNEINDRINICKTLTEC